MHSALFALVLLAFFLALVRKWELSPKVAIPWSILMAALGVTLSLLLSRIYPDLHPVLRVAVSAAVALGVSVVALAYRFFRDPERVSPSRGNVILSPADGKVIYVKRISNGEFPVAIKKGRRIALSEFTGHDLALEDGVQIGIAMSFIDVHVNRSPIAGRVVTIKRVPGQFRSLKYLDSLMENERVFTQIGSDAVQVGIVQIASRLVRRIDSYVQENDLVTLGQRIGMIKFGSQVDLIIAHGGGLTVNVKEGEEVKAGLSVVATY